MVWFGVLSWSYFILVLQLKVSKSLGTWMTEGDLYFLKLVPKILIQTCCSSTSYILVTVSIYRNNVKIMVGWVTLPYYYITTSERAKGRDDVISAWQELRLGREEELPCRSFPIIIWWKNIVWQQEDGYPTGRKSFFHYWISNKHLGGNEFRWYMDASHSDKQDREGRERIWNGGKWKVVSFISFHAINLTIICLINYLYFKDRKMTQNKMNN